MFSKIEFAVYYPHDGCENYYVFRGTGKYRPLNDTFTTDERCILKGSIERIDFIVEYISAYESKIKLANK